MDDQNKIRKFVRSHIYKGRELSDIFNNLYKEFYGEASNFGAPDFTRWFRYLRLDTEKKLPSDSWYAGLSEQLPPIEGPPALKYNPTIEGNVNYVDMIPPQEFHLALHIIFDEFSKLQRTYEFRRCARNTDKHDCKMELISARYAVDAGEDSQEKLTIFIMDTYHNEKREIEISGEGSSNNLVTGFVPLDSTHFFCQFNYEDMEEDDSMEICIFKVDVTQMECTALDKHKYDDNLDQILIDSVDPHKFLFLHHSEDDEKYVHRGCLTADGKLNFEEEKLNIDILIPDRHVGIYHDGYKFAGDKFYGLCRDTDNSEFIAFEATFVKGKAQILQLINFGVETTLEYEYDKVLWSGNACYIFMHIYNHEDALYKFDLDTQQMTKITLPVYDKVCCASLKDGVMTIGTLSHELQHAWHRISLSQPDTLLNLSMDHLQREAIFMDDVEYVKFIQKLPPNLRPFGGISALKRKDSEVSEKDGNSRKRSLSGSSTEENCAKK